MDAGDSDHRLHAGPASLRGPPDGARPAIPVNWPTDATSPEPTPTALLSSQCGRSPPSGWGKHARLFDSVKPNWRGNRGRPAAGTNEVVSAYAPGDLEQFSRTRAARRVDIIDTGTPLVTGRIFGYERDHIGWGILDGHPTGGYRGEFPNPSGRARGTERQWCENPIRVGSSPWRCWAPASTRSASTVCFGG